MNCVKPRLRAFRITPRALRLARCRKSSATSVGLYSLQVFFGGKLQIEVMGIASAIVEQELVAPGFDDAAVLDDVDFVGVDNRMKSVRDN